MGYSLENWRNKGDFKELGKHRLFVVDEGAGEKAIVLLHGYPTSSYDFHRVFDDFSKLSRTVIHDHLGFGLSDKPTKYSYSLIEQADYALQLWEDLGIQEVVIIAHDYGTSVATEIIKRHNLGNLNIRINGIVLSNGSVHIELADLRIVQHLLASKSWGKLSARLSNYWLFKLNMRRLWYDKSVINEQELKDMWSLINHNNGRKVFHLVSRYIKERRQFWHRWIGGLEETELPISIVWGRQDPVAVSAIAEQLHSEIPNSELVWLESLGHYPMLEAPERWAKAVIEAIQKYF